MMFQAQNAPGNPNPLEQLRDIHTAPDVPWWPPAPGWWVVVAILMFVLFMLGRRLLHQWRERRRRQGWLNYLDTTVTDIDVKQAPQDYLSTINKVFKAVAIRAFPDEHCAGLEGSAWTDFLAGKLGAAHPELQVLADGPYQPAPEFDPEAVTLAARHWIRKYG